MFKRTLLAFALVGAMAACNSPGASSSPAGTIQPGPRRWAATMSWSPFSVLTGTLLCGSVSARNPKFTKE